MGLTGIGMNGPKFALPLLVALSVALGPPFLPDSRCNPRQGGAQARTAGN
jgi:hypothetical protein